MAAKHFRVVFRDGHRATVEAESVEEAKVKALAYLKEHRFEVDHLDDEAVKTASVLEVS